MNNNDVQLDRLEFEKKISIINVSGAVMIKKRQGDEG